MSTSTLTGLRDYLYDTLSPANMLWLSTQLADYAKKKEEAPLKRYTKAELNALLDEAEANIAAGNTIPGEEVWRELEEEFAKEDAEEVKFEKGEEDGKAVYEVEFYVGVSKYEYDIEIATGEIIEYEVDD